MNLLQNKKFIYRATSITFIVSVFTCTVFLTGSLDRLEWLSYDWRMSTVREQTSASDEVVVVLIDDASLKALEPIAGRWPWPRWIYADLLEFFAMGGPKAVLFDILFTERQIDNADDARLVEATANSPFAYHSGRFVLDSDDEFNKGLLNRDLPAGIGPSFSVNSRYSTNGERKNLDLNFPSNNRYYLPFNELAEASNGIGVVDVNADKDGVYRRIRLLHRYKEHYFPALSSIAQLDQNPPRKIARENGHLYLDDLRIPISDDGKYLLNFYTHYTTYSLSGIMASMQMIMAGNLDNLLVSPYEFEDKIVFIGASAAGLEDLKTTPVDGRLPGVLVHATAASNLIQKDFIKLPNSSMTILVIILMAGVVAFTTLLVKRALIQNTIPILLLGGYTWLCFRGLANQQLHDMVAPLMATLLSWAASFSSLLLFEGREKRKFKRMMSQYLSPQVLSTVVSNHEDFAKAEVGSKEEVSMLFSDIRGFTNMSEYLSPEIVVEILNRYFSHMTEAIFSTEGTIDKFIGDAIMAFWGAPVKTATHPQDATIAALEMLEQLQLVTQWLEERSYPNLSIGIGLHTGDVILGNIGSEHKLDYTIIGDNVNLASRIEGLTKQYGCQILLTESTYQRLEDNIPCRRVDMVRVKGKQNPIAIYQPIINPARASSQQLDIARQFAERSAEAFAYYLDRQWIKVESILGSFPDDMPTKILLERSRNYKKVPPPDDWDGAFTMTSK